MAIIGTHSDPARILIVEDDELTAEHLRLHLHQAGYEVAGVATSGEEAIRLGRTLRPDLAILDIVLPGQLDGIQVAEAFRASQQIPVLFLTAFGAEEFVRRAKGTAPFAYLLKPFTARELQLAIELALPRRARAESEDRLRASQARYQRVIEFMPDAFFLIDRAAMRFLDVNAAACAGSGYTRDELLGMGPQDIKPHFNKAMLAARFDEVIASESHTGVIETWHRRKDGSLYPVEVKLGVLEGGSNPRLIATARDLSAARAAEFALRESEQRFRLVFENAPIGLVILSLDYRLVEVNAAFSRMLGYSPEELKEISLADITFPADLGVSLDHIRRLFGGEIAHYSVEIRGVRKSGEAFWASVVGTVVRDAEGRPLYGLGIIEDIDARKAAEARRAQEEAAYRDMLVREVHHRIKNNLQGVAGLLRDYLHEHPELAAIGETMIARIQAVSIVHGLQGRLSSEDVMLREMLTETVRSANAALLAPDHVEIDIRLEEDWPLDKDKAIPVALALNELLTNAIKHRDLRSAVRKVKLRVEEEGDGVRITITNPLVSPEDGGTPSKSNADGVGLALICSILPVTDAEVRVSASAGQWTSALLLKAALKSQV